MSLCFSSLTTYWYSVFLERAFLSATCFDIYCQTGMNLYRLVSLLHLKLAVFNETRCKVHILV